MSEINTRLKFKNEKWDDPEFYLGARLKKKSLPNGKAM